MPFENLLNISVKKDYIDYLSALLTPTVAIAGLYIAVNHKRIEEARLRHELFERRYKQFDAVTKFTFSVTSYSLEADEEYVTYDEELIFLPEIAGMKFIFNEEIENFVNDSIIQLYEEIQQARSDYIKINLSEKRLKNAKLQRNLKQKLRKNLLIFQQKTLKYMQLQQTGPLKYLLQHLAILYEKIKTKRLS
ncbi:MAG: hypothetical protein D3917_12105 [Candidatus Electrothrix sp. AX5]|nr:hypothetical protein [Candidatus Electrothrix sp. AX5]